MAKTVLTFKSQGRRQVRWVPTMVHMRLVTAGVDMVLVEDSGYGCSRADNTSVTLTAALHAGVARS